MEGQKLRSNLISDIQTRMEDVVGRSRALIHIQRLTISISMYVQMTSLHKLSARGKCRSWSSDMMMSSLDNYRLFLNTIDCRFTNSRRDESELGMHVRYCRLCICLPTSCRPMFGNCTDDGACVFNSRNLLVNFVLILPRIDRRKLVTGRRAFSKLMLYVILVPTWKLHTVA